MKNQKSQKRKLSLEKTAITKLDNKAKRSIVGAGSGLGHQGGKTKTFMY
ncbi:hypothetical protein ATE84_4136 [Aquimarina sp. MAR_2010_214]|nr:class I lanthipeptide [Aquimarina sp. MAR_2010_214]PKV52035.1 hypothetical protein ATE84_4136 [Aquimarina sp. MAR_2010_214]